MTTLAIPECWREPKKSPGSDQPATAGLASYLQAAASSRGEALGLGRDGAAWAAAGMLAAEAQFRRVKGDQELPKLSWPLEHATAEEPGMLDPPAAVGT
jgi:hypothetical protein